MKAKKSLGQHFLKSEAALSDIINAADLHKDEVVVEVGPGKGILTEALLENGACVIAVETDERMIKLLEQKLSKWIASGKLRLIFKDVRDFDLRELRKEVSQYKVVANIPYYITGEILRMFLESDFQPSLMVLLVQKEVAERVVAKDGKQSILSLSVSIYGEPKLIRDVPAQDFEPAPKVDSAILCINKISKERLGKIDEKKYFGVVRRAFAYKRKTLLNNFSGIEREVVERFLIERGLDPRIRAESLSMEDWLSLVVLI